MKQEDKKEIPNIERQGWSAEQLVEESANKDADETFRQMLRGDESEGDPDERDIAGAPKASDTPQGREESKNKTDKN